MVVICHVNVRSLVAGGRLLNVSSLVSFNNVEMLYLSETADFSNANFKDPSLMMSPGALLGRQPPAVRRGAVRRRAVRRGAKLLLLTTTTNYYY